jgi:hypothetical protein
MLYKAGKSATDDSFQAFPYFLFPIFYFLSLHSVEKEKSEESQKMKEEN